MFSIVVKKKSGALFLIKDLCKKYDHNSQNIIKINKNTIKAQ